MIQLVSSPSLLLPVLTSLTLFVILAIILVIYQRKNQYKFPSIKRSLKLFRLNLILMAICIAIFAVTTQVLTSTLQSFGYPDGLEDIQTAEQTLAYLQQYNRAIVTNAHALLWFFYVFTVWFLTALYAFARAIVDDLSARPSE